MNKGTLLTARCDTRFPLSAAETCKTSPAGWEVAARVCIQDTAPQSTDTYLHRFKN